MSDSSFQAGRPWGSTSAALVGWLVKPNHPFYLIIRSWRRKNLKKYKQEQQQQHWTGSWLQSPKVWFPILTRVFFSQSVPCCYGKLLCFALPVKRGKHFKKKQQQFILLARPRGCQNSNCLRVKKSASTSGPPKPPRTVWVQLSYPLSEKLPKVTGSESRAYYKIWLRCYQSLMLLNTTKFLCPKTNGIWFFVWENYQVREEIHHTVNVVQWSKNEHPLP